MALHFDPVTHTYTLNGKVVPSVTQIIRPLEEDALSRIPTEVLEWKRGLGQQVHLACQLEDEGDLDLATVDERITGYVQAWRNWKEDHGFTVDMNERPLASWASRFAGTVDRYGFIQGISSSTQMHVNCAAVVDLKTRVDLPDAIGVQLAGYNRLLAEHFKWSPVVAPPLRVAVQLKPDGTYSHRVYENPEDIACFAACLALHHWKAKRK